MKILSHVVWSEGMFLSPLHFQTQSRNFEDTLTVLRSALWTEPWGLAYFSLDSEAIRNGRVVLLEASGIFPDGLVFDVPGSDLPPESRSIQQAFPSTEASLALFLAVPGRAPSGQSCALEGRTASLRYFSEPRLARDETNGVDERELLFAVRNLRIVTEAELTPDLITLPLATVVRDGRGNFAFDPDFIPPCVRLGASEALVLLLKRLLDGIAEKIAVLAPRARSGGRFEAGTSALDVASYWFLHALSTSLPVLRHLQLSHQSHPERLFVELSRLAGALCTFATESDPANLPAYDHGNPGPAFRQLDAHIRRHLDIVVPTGFVPLNFADAAPYIREADVTDERCLRRSRWIFGIRSSLGEADLIGMTPRLIKVCSARFVPELVRRALPGLTLHHLPVPPAAIRAEADKQYFSVELTGPCWEHIQQTRRVGVYVPGEIADAEYDLNIVVEPSA